MANIGNLAAQVTANATPFMTTMNNVKSSLTSVKTHAASVGKTLLSTFGGGLGAGLLGGFGIHQLVHHLKAGLDATLELRSASRSLGISIGQVAGLKLASGSHWEGAQSAISKMLKGLGQARVGAGDAARGFALLHLEADSLSDLPTEKVLGKIADALKKIVNPAERAYIAATIFGKGWLEIMPMLNKGSTGMAEAAAAANRFGELTQKAADDAAKLKKELAQLSSAWDSFWVGAATSVDRFFGQENNVNELFEYLFNPNYQDLAVERALKMPDDEKNRVHNAEGGKEGWEKRAKEWQKSEKLKKIAEDEAAELPAKIADLREHLLREREAIEGTTSSVTQFARAHKFATENMLAAARADEAHNKTLKANKLALEEQARALKELQDLGAKVTEAAKSPFESFTAEMEQLDDLLKRGIITWAVYGASASKALDQLATFNPKAASYQAPPAMLAGSNEAMRTIQAHRNAGKGGGDNATERVKQVLEQAREYQRQTAKNTAEIAEALKGNKIAVKKI